MSSEEIEERLKNAPLTIYSPKVEEVYDSLRNKNARQGKSSNLSELPSK